MKKEQQTIYVSPKVKTVEIKAQAIICQSTDTEKFGMSGHSYNEYDWE